MITEIKKTGQQLATEISMALDEPVAFVYSYTNLHRFELSDGLKLTVAGSSYFCEDGKSDWTEAFTLDELATDVAVWRSHATQVGA
jgi:hypothetical protein